jgi:hypothetical protein
MEVDPGELLDQPMPLSLPPSPRRPVNARISPAVIQLMIYLKT